MVFLAEEGLCAEGGRAFDHAWQEMLNHATMRVKQSLKYTQFSYIYKYYLFINYLIKLLIYIYDYYTS